MGRFTLSLMIGILAGFAPALATIHFAPTLTELFDFDFLKTVWLIGIGGGFIISAAIYGLAKRTFKKGGGLILLAMVLGIILGTAFAYGIGVHYTMPS